MSMNTKPTMPSQHEQLVDRHQPIALIGVFKPDEFHLGERRLQPMAFERVPGLVYAGFGPLYW